MFDSDEGIFQTVCIRKAFYDKSENLRYDNFIDGHRSHSWQS